MIALKIDENGDFVYQNGTFQMVEGDEQLVQEIRIAIETNKNEWFLDYEEGMDRNYLLGKNYDENRARSSIIESLINLSQTVFVENVTFQKVARTLFVNIALRKEDGTRLNVEGVRI